MKTQYPLQMSQETGTSDDRRIVSGVLAKDRKVTAEFVSRCADWIYPFVRHRLVPRGELVEDLMQEVLLTAWQALPNFRGDATLRSWVMGIARHKLEDYYRRRIREVEVSEDDDDSLSNQVATPAFEQQLDSAAQQKRVQRVLAMLPEAYALALIWQYRDEKSVRDMAQLTGKTEKAMERLLARARETFRRRWSDGQA
jgi:RNA polymerase sigma-70 factor (ECF subfamily)